ncbi:MAG TPA: T9SS type A sorting domain-containing protein [Flavitalea sp.]|nr:T9SS type A sorting domain-containing protein [Flavitalea sp.]
MKTIFTSLLTFLVLALNAQKVYSIKSSETWNEKTTYDNACFDCVFNIAEGVVITVDKDITFSNVTINGGTFIFNSKELMLWNKGAKFIGTKATFKKNSKLTGNGFLSMQNSQFGFLGTSNVLINQSLTMVSSRMNFNENSSLLGNNNTIDLTNSQLVAGDGLLSSKAYVYMNGAKLTLQDKTSGVEVLNSNNYYFNWSTYYSDVTKTGYNTTNNKNNCGASYPNACSAPIVYGPIAITPTGLGSTLILPVVITDFGVVNNNNIVNISWSTQQESNSAYFSIERSVDGINWNQIGQVKAKGNSAVVVKYSFSDLTPVNGAAHYRLKMVDLDNKIAYSDVKSIRSSAIASVKVYPNPATDYVNITLDAKAGNSTIKLINQSGQIISEKFVSANSGVVTMPLKQYQDGTYVIRISDDKGSNQAIKLMVFHSK